MTHPLTGYMSAVRRHKVLPQHEVQELIRQAQQQQGTREGLWARNRVLCHNLPLVVFIAKEFYLNRGLPLEDLIGYGVLGLEKSIRDFDLSKGFKFSSYAYWKIRSELDFAIHNTAWLIRISEHRHEKNQRIRRVIVQMKLELGRLPTFAEVGDRLNKPEAWVKEQLTTFEYFRHCHSLDTQLEGKEGVFGSWLERTPDDRPSAIDEAAKQQELDRVKSALEQIHPVHRNVILLHIENGLSFSQISEEIGVSKGKAHYFYRTGLKQLKQILEEEPHARANVYPMVRTQSVRMSS